MHTCRLAGALGICFLTTVLFSTADAAETKTFESYKCQLTLPGPKYTWLDVSKMPGAAAGFTEDSGVNFILLADRDSDFRLSKAAIAGFETGLMKPGITTKIDGTMIQFQGVPCYQMNVRHIQNDTLLTVRLLVANGYWYQLMLIRPSSLILDPAKIESLFSSFQFIGTPSPPAATPHAATNDPYYTFGYHMGQILGLCLIAIVAILVVRLVTRKGKKDTI